MIVGYRCICDNDEADSATECDDGVAAVTEAKVGDYTEIRDSVVTVKSCIWSGILPVVGSASHSGSCGHIVDDWIYASFADCSRIRIEFGWQCTCLD